VVGVKKYKLMLYAITLSVTLSLPQYADPNFHVYSVKRYTMFYLQIFLWVSMPHYADPDFHVDRVKRYKMFCLLISFVGVAAELCGFRFPRGWCQKVQVDSVRNYPMVSLSYYADPDFHVDGVNKYKLILYAITLLGVAATLCGS
jgi:hypothetical protein